MSKNKISIIIPIYNIEKYIHRCVDSVIAQSYKNIEIILVDDGSTDSSAEICDKYKQKDERIIVIHKKNGGLSDARNAGIKASSGDYLFFLDGDDYISTDCIYELFKTLNDNHADISTTKYINFYDGEKPKRKKGHSLLNTTEDALRNMLYQIDCTNSAWGKLYKKELFKNIEYPFGKICEDLATTYLIFGKAKKIVINTSYNYFYYQRKDSIIQSSFKPERAEGLRFAKLQKQYIEKHYPKIINAAINREFMEAVYVILAIGYNKKYNNVKDKAYETIKKYRKTVLKDKESNKRSRQFAIISIFGPGALLLSMKIMNLISKKK